MFIIRKPLTAAEEETTYMQDILLSQYGFVLLLALVFADGLLFGIAIKKGMIAFVLVIAALLIAYAIGLVFIPRISVSSLIRLAMTYFSAIRLGTAGLAGTIVLWLIGLAFGFLRAR